MGDGGWGSITFGPDTLYGCLLQVEIKQKKKPTDSRRTSSFVYKLKLEDGTSVHVCKPLFASTLGISQRTVASWVAAYTHADPAEPNNNPHRPQKGNNNNNNYPQTLKRI